MFRILLSIAYDAGKTHEKQKSMIMGQQLFFYFQSFETFENHLTQLFVLAKL